MKGSGCSSWGTPQTSDGKEGSQTSDPKGYLKHQATQWGTPKASDGEKGGPRNTPTSLKVVAENWPSLFSLPDQETSMPGNGCSASDQTSRRRLNPRFVTWLMGLPFGLTSFELSETPCRQFKQAMRSYLYSLVSEEN